MLVDFNNPEKLAAQNGLVDYLKSQELDLSPFENSEIVKEGNVCGEVFAGNLSMFCTLIGTPWQEIFRDKILVIEELFEVFFRIDRMMKQLRHSGILGVVKGVIIGSMDKMVDSSTPYGKSIKEIVLDNLKDFDGPIVWSAPSGHGKSNTPISCSRELVFSTVDGIVKLLSLIHI